MQNTTVGFSASLFLIFVIVVADAAVAVVALNLETKRI